MATYAFRNAFDCTDLDLEASEDEVADFIEGMLNELSLLATDRVTSLEARERISEKIGLFQVYFAGRKPRLLC